MKKTLLLFATLFCVTFLYAQDNAKQLTNEEFFTQADLVFEGYLLKTVDIYDSKGNDIYNSKYDDCYRITAYIVQQIYKGPKYNTGDTIFIITQGASLDLKDMILDNSNKRRDYSKGTSMAPSPFLYKIGFDCSISNYMPSIYFLVHSDFPDDINSKYALCQKYKYLTLYGDSSKEVHYNKMYICRNKIIGLDSLIFHQREDFYSYMKQFDGFRVPEPAPQPVKQPEKN